MKKYIYVVAISVILSLFAVSITRPGDSILGGTTNFDSIELSEDLSVTGAVYLGTGGTSSVAVATTTATSTPELFVGAKAGVSTSTLQVGSTDVDGCLQFYENGVAKRVYVNGTSLVVQNGTCK